jgi:hypothetical protein
VTTVQSALPQLGLYCLDALMLILVNISTVTTHHAVIIMSEADCCLIREPSVTIQSRLARHYCVPTDLIKHVNHAVSVQTVTSPHRDQYELITVYITASSLYPPVSTEIHRKESSDSTNYKS